MRLKQNVKKEEVGKKIAMTFFLKEKENSRNNMNILSLGKKRNSLGLWIHIKERNWGGKEEFVKQKINKNGNNVEVKSHLENMGWDIIDQENIKLFWILHC